MLKLPSIAHAAAEAWRAVRRFPYMTGCAVSATAIAIWLIEARVEEPAAIKLLFSVLLGLPLFIAVELFADRLPAGGSRARPALRVTVLALLVLLFGLGLRDHTTNYYYRYFQLSLVCHLFVSFAPYVFQRETNGFWHFNRLLFRRVLLSASYGIAFFAGLAIALASLEFLFDVHLHRELFADLWVLSLLLQTLHFAAGVPVVSRDLDACEDYPLALKIFVQYMLVPLIALYGAILYAYMGKIALASEWPKGFVGWLVSGFCFFGMFSLLLLYPVAERHENLWMKRFSRAFYFAAPPLVLMLFVAVGKRIHQYGITELRYDLATLGLWLVCMSLYLALGRSKQIKLIPVTLAIVAGLTALGPWGAYAVAQRSQRARLSAILLRTGILRAGKIKPAARSVGDDDRKQISEILDYLTERHGSAALEGWLTPSELASIRAEESPRRADLWDVRYANTSPQIMQRMRLEYLGRYSEAGREYFHYGARRDVGQPLRVADYEWLLPSRLLSRNDRACSRAPFAAFCVALDGQGTKLEIFEHGNRSDEIALAPLVEKLRKAHASPAESVPAREMVLTGELAERRYWLEITQLGGRMNGATPELDVLEASVLLGPRRQ